LVAVFTVALSPLLFLARDSIMLSALLSPVRQSVLLSVTRVDQSKTVEVRIVAFSPNGSHIPLALRGKFHPEILTGSPRAGQ